MKCFSVIFFLLSSLGLASTPPMTVQSFPGQVKVLVDLKMLGSTAAASDILFVIDDSTSMESFQTNLAGNFNSFTSALVKSNVDYHIAAVTTTMELPYFTKSPTQSSGGQFITVDGIHVVTPQTPSADVVLSKLLQPGTVGDPTEKPFAAVSASLSSPLIETSNSGFLRPYANLVVIFVTDAPEQSGVSAESMFLALNAIKSGKTNSVLAFGVLPDNSGQCHGEGGPSLEIQKLLALMPNAGSNQMSLCSPDFGSKLAQFANTIAQSQHDPSAPQPTTDISHIRLPSAASFETITVRYGTQELIKGDVVHGWVYNSVSDEVQIGNQVPWTTQPQGTQLEITYTPMDWIL